VAVCLLPGTEVTFEKNVECRPFISVLPNRKVGENAARFRQIDMDKTDTHHDALEFSNGQIVLLDRLCEDQRATVLQLPAALPFVTEAQEQKLNAHVS
jgi:hypothetical protein